MKKHPEFSALALITVMLVGMGYRLDASSARAPGFGAADLDYGNWEFQHPPPPTRSPGRVDWAHPPIACVEDLVPVKPNRPCLDLSRVDDPRTDWPIGATPQELKYWKETKRPMQFCRALEVERREATQPGSFTTGALQMAWLQKFATEKPAEKIRAIYAASRDYKVPAAVLTGALYQESLIAEIGISPDGNNYSCGIGQFNVIGWCAWANTTNKTVRTAIGWPESGADCGSLQRTFVAPFFDIAKKNLGSEPVYKISARHFAGIQLRDVVHAWPSASADVQQLRFQMVTSFVQNCAGAEYGIRAKARELSEIYSRYLPSGLKDRERAFVTYSASANLCQEKGSQETYPLQTAWLLAVASYNSGPTAVDLVAYYNRLTPEEMKSPSKFANFDPKLLVSSLFWGGRYNAQTDQIDFRSKSGRAMSWSWFRQCVVQRHVARIVQHVLRAGAPSIIESLEGPDICAKSQVDPSTGKVVHSAVPLKRQASSGVR